MGSLLYCKNKTKKDGRFLPEPKENDPDREERMTNVYQKDLERTEKIKKRNRRRKPERREKLLLAVKIVLIVLLVFFIAAIGGLFLLRGIGKKQLQETAVGSAEEMRMNRHHTSESARNDGDSAQEEEADETESDTSGMVSHNGRLYRFNQDIMTFLVMGIDQRSERVMEQTEGFEGGSADAIFLVVLNPHVKKMQIVAIDRNTMTDVDIYDYYGNYKETVTTQLCVQHGFGDGTAGSAGYMEKSVSNLLYGLPINGYCAVNMSAIEKINDAVGGVEVTVLEDLTKWDRSLKKGEKVLLEGRSAFLYVQKRDTGIFGSAEGRLERQKQYIGAFIQKAKEEFKSNRTLPVTLFETLKPYMTTDLNVEKAVYLAGMAADFDFKATDVRKIDGKNVMGEDYEEFYIDETAMYELVLDIFYEEVSDESGISSVRD